MVLLTPVITSASTAQRHARDLSWGLPISQAREWRCKYTPAKDDAPLKGAFSLLRRYQPMIRATPGFRSITHSICRVKHELKVAITVDEHAYGPWEANAFEPEPGVTSELASLAGIANVETQSFIMSVG